MSSLLEIKANLIKFNPEILKNLKDSDLIFLDIAKKEISKPININKNKSENNINAKVTNASFVGNSYQYILSTNIGKIYVISKDTINTFKINPLRILDFNFPRRSFRMF